MRIFIAGHHGMVGSAILRMLTLDPNIEIVTRNRSELDLTNQSAVDAFFAESNFDQVYLAAAKVGGIHANNTYPAEFIYENFYRRPSRHGRFCHPQKARARPQC